jgi:hypothetical protein
VDRPDLYDQHDTEPKWEGDGSIDLQRQPERVAGRLALSTSLIDQGHRTTWGPGGLILRAPTYNVIDAAPHDLGTPNNNADLLRRHARDRSSEGPLPEPEAMLHESVVGEVNEAVVLGTRGDSVVELAGFFYHKNVFGRPVDAAMTRDLRRHAERLAIPIVGIPLEETMLSHAARLSKAYVVDLRQRFVDRNIQPPAESLPQPSSAAVDPDL